MKKQQVDSFLAITKQFAAYVPVYGPLAEQAIEAGRIINEQQPDRYILLEPTLGFSPTTPLNYGLYLAASQDGLATFGPSIVYDDESIVEQVVVDAGQPLPDNYVVLEIVKGDFRSFEEARSDSAKELIDAANDMTVGDRQQVEQYINNMTEAVKKVASASKMAEIVASTNYRQLASIERSLIDTRSLGNLITDSDRARFIRSIATYFDISVRPQESATLDGWIAFVRDQIDKGVEFNRRTQTFEIPPR